MKKIMALLLALSLLICGSVTAFAVESDGSSQSEPDHESVVEPAEESKTSEEPKANEDSETSTEPEASEDPETSEEPEVAEDPEKNENPEVADNPETGENPETSEETKPVPSEGSSGGTTSNDALSREAVDAENNDEPAEIANTYNVTVSWSGMSFTYHEPSLGTWHPEMDPPQYVGGSNKGTWTSSDDNGYGTFTVVNNEQSGASVTVEFTFQPGDLGNDVGMRFSNLSGADAKTADPQSSASVRVSASGTANMYVVPAISSSVGSEDFYDTSNINFGMINITVTPSSWSDPSVPEGPGIG